MPITVRELTRVPHLRTRVLAGAAGLERDVAWAPATELPDPWEWLGDGELLMTNGLGLPAAPSEQAAYLERLDEAGACGVAVGEGPAKPELSDRMRRTADRLGLPLLLTAYEVSFAALARAVAGANEPEEHARLVRTMRVYDTVRLAAAERLTGAALLARLGRTGGCGLHLLGQDGARALLPGAPDPPPGLSEALRAALAGRGTNVPGVVRPPVPYRHAVALPVPSERPALLAVVPEDGVRPDLAVLRHVAAIAGLELERLAAERERCRRLGATLLADVIDQRIAAEAAAGQLGEHGLTGPLRIVACRAGAPEDAELHVELAERRIAHLLLQRADVLLALLGAGDASAFGAALRSDAHLGASRPFEHAERTAEAAAEARWALELAEAQGVPIVEHGEMTGASPFLPRSLEEARRAVDRVLGPLLDYDASHGSDLVATLRTFLRQNRSWQRAAAALQVHKQTLVYRVKRIETLTGRRLDSTADVAELWLALRAHDAVGGGRSLRTPG